MNAFLQSVSDSWMAWCVFTLASTSVLLIAVSIIVFLISAVGLRKWSPGLLSVLFFMVLLKPFVPVSVTVPDTIASRLPTVVSGEAISLESQSLQAKASALPARLVSPSSFGMEQKVTASIESNTIAMDVTKRAGPVTPIKLAAAVLQTGPQNLSWSVTLLLGYVAFRE